MKDLSLCYFSALELANKIQKGEVSALEVMETHLAQIEKVNPKVNAIVTLIPELALENAKKADEKKANLESNVFLGLIAVAVIVTGVIASL